MRRLFKDGYTADKAAIQRLDNDVFQELKRLRLAGRTFVRAGELARRFSVNSVEALGSMERLKPKLRKAGII